MRRHPSPSPWVLIALGFLVTGLIDAPAFADQSSKTSKQLTSGPLRIVGTRTSGGHCVSGSSANVHALGWIERGSSVTITFESDFDPIAGIVTLGIEPPSGRGAYIVDDDSGGNLEPEIRYTASITGNAALYVSGYNSTQGCYWYNLQMIPPARSVVDAMPSLPAKAPVAGPRGITGLPSVAYHCIAGNGVANIHSIGRVGRGARVTVTFDTDYDAVAGLANLDLFAANPQPRYTYDDDSGGRLAPELRLTTTQEGTIALYVGGYDGVAGCYRYKVEIQ